MYGFIKADLCAAVVLLIKWETCTVQCKRCLSRLIPHRLKPGVDAGRP